MKETLLPLKLQLSRNFDAEIRVLFMEEMRRQLSCPDQVQLVQNASELGSFFTFIELFGFLLSPDMLSCRAHFPFLVLHVSKLDSLRTLSSGTAYSP